MNRQKKMIVILLIVLLGLAFFFEKKGYLNLQAPKKSLLVAPNLAQYPLSEIDASISIEVDDLLKIAYALDRYKQDHRSYPIGSSLSGARRWDGIKSNWGESREDWIRGLAPKYIDSLPRDPRVLDDGEHQYLYMSDGANYKLIAYQTVNCQLIKNSLPSLVDPKRDCQAFGFWTKKATDW